MEPSHHNLHLVWRGDCTAVHELQWYISRAVANEGVVPALKNSHASAMCISTFAFALSPTRRRGRRRASGPMGSSRCGHPCPRAPMGSSCPLAFPAQLLCMPFIGFKRLAAKSFSWTVFSDWQLDTWRPVSPDACLTKSFASSMWPQNWCRQMMFIRGR